MVRPRSPLLRLWPAAVPLLVLAPTSCRALSTPTNNNPPRPSPPAAPSVEPAAAGRRAFLSAAALTVASTSLPSRTRAAWLQAEEEDWKKRADKSDPVDYASFKELLADDRVSDVEFGSDGRSLAFRRTVDGRTNRVVDPTDDPGLLKELYARGVDVSIREYRFKKQMNSYNWLRELVGDELTDEEKYKYKGYKTYRQNMPERSYVPSNLITGYDLSRAIKKEEERKRPTGFFEDLNYFVKNGNKRPGEP